MGLRNIFRRPRPASNIQACPLRITRLSDGVTTEHVLQMDGPPPADRLESCPLPAPGEPLKRYELSITLCDTDEA